MRYLILGPGALGFFSMLGSLNRLGEEQLKDVEEISGASAGSLVGLFILLGYSPQQILDLSLTLNIESATELNLKNLFSEFGLINHSEIKNILINIFKVDPTLTFQELYNQTNKKLHIATYCINKSQTEYFSVDNYPQVCILDAICMSISVPFLFSPFKFNDFHYLDGGTIEAVPFFPFLNKKQDDIFCISIKTIYETFNEIKDFQTYTFSFIKSIRNAMNKDYIKNLLELDVSSFNIYDFSMDNETKIKLFLLGYESARSNISL